MINLDFPKESRKLLYCFYLLGRQNTPSRWAAKNLEDYTVDRERKSFLKASRKGADISIPKVDIYLPENSYTSAIIKDSRREDVQLIVALGGNARKKVLKNNEEEVLREKEIKIRYHPEGRSELQDFV